MQRKVHNEVNIIIELTIALKYEGVCIWGGGVREGVCIWGKGRRLHIGGESASGGGGGQTPAGTRKAGSTHPTGMLS